MQPGLGLSAPYFDGHTGGHHGIGPPPNWAWSLVTTAPARSAAAARRELMIRRRIVVLPFVAGAAGGVMIDSRVSAGRDAKRTSNRAKHEKFMADIRAPLTSPPPWHEVSGCANVVTQHRAVSLSRKLWRLVA